VDDLGGSVEQAGQNDEGVGLLDEGQASAVDEREKKGNKVSSQRTR
jgi:hypothetical protein